MPNRCNYHCYRIFLLGILLIHSTVLGQGNVSLKFKKLTIADGLPHSIVKKVVKDSSGYIWVGTGNGLAKYNGIEFKTFLPDENDPLNSLSHFIIADLFVSKDNKLWILTDRGIDLYDPKTERIKNLSYDTSLFFSKRESVQTDKDDSKMEYTSDSSFWTCGSYNIVHYNLKENKLSVINSRKFTPKNRFRSIASYGNSLFVSYQDGVAKIDPNDNFIPLQLNLPTDLTNDNTLESIKIIDTKLYIYLSGYGFLIYDLIKEKTTNIIDLRHYNIDFQVNTTISDIEFIDETLWIASNIGLFTYTEKSNELLLHKPNKFDPFSVSALEIFDFFIDNNKMLWMGTNMAGINYLDLNANYFKSHYNIPLDDKSLPSNDIMAIYKSREGIIWAGTWANGIIRQTSVNSKFDVFKEGNRNSIGITWYFANSKIIQDKSDNIYFVYWANGINLLDKKTNKDFKKDNLIFKNIFDDPKWNIKITRWALRDAIIDKDNNMWIASFQYGIQKVELNDLSKNEYFEKGGNDINKFGNSDYWCINSDQNGNIWAGSHMDGLYYFNPISKETKRITQIPNDKTSLPSKAVKQIYCSPSGYLWLATENGLCKFNPKTFKSEGVYNKLNGLNNNNLYGVMEDKAGDIWVTSDNGLARFSPKTNTFRNYNTFNGLQNAEYGFNSYFNSSDGEMFVGGNKGFDSFYPEQVKSNPFPASAVISELKISNKHIAPGESIKNKTILKYSVNYSDEINLSWKENDFSFTIEALHFSEPKKNQIAYKLEGYHEDWIYTTNAKTEAFFSNLPGGNYTLMVKAANSDGIWTEKSTNLKINVSPPFWTTWWFYTLLLISASSGIYAVIRAREKSAKEQKLKLETEIEIQTSKIKKQTEEIENARAKEKIHNWQTEGFALISGIITKSNATSLNNLSQEILTSIIKYVEAYSGVIVLINSDENSVENELKIVARYAPPNTLLQKENFKIGEGVIGQCFKDKEFIKIQNASNEFYSISSGLGETAPGEIICIPIKADKLIVGVMELSFFKPISVHTERLLEQLAEMMALNFNNAILNYKTKKILEQSQKQQELQATQEVELKQNMEELMATQEEMERKATEYKRKIDTLEETFQVKTKSKD